MSSRNLPPGVSEWMIPGVTDVDPPDNCEYCGRPTYIEDDDGTFIEYRDLEFLTCGRPLCIQKEKRNQAHDEATHSYLDEDFVNTHNPYPPLAKEH